MKEIVGPARLLSRAEVLARPLPVPGLVLQVIAPHRDARQGHLQW